MALRPEQSCKRYTAVVSCHRAPRFSLRQSLKNAASQDRQAVSPSYHRRQTSLIAAARFIRSKRIALLAQAQLDSQAPHQPERNRLAWRRNFILSAFIVMLFIASSSSVQASEARIAPINALKGTSSFRRLNTIKEVQIELAGIDN